MADNTRKTSNIIHEVADIKSDVSNNSQNIQNNTDAIGNISIPSVGDGAINLEAGDGLTLSTGSQNAKANQDGDTTFKIEANLTYLNDNLNIPVGGVSKIVAGDNVTISPANGTGDVTINAAGGGSGGIPEAPINGKQYGREDGNWTEVTSATPVVPGDGNITLKSTDNTVSITGANATANQTTDTAWDLSVNIPTPIAPGDGNITLTEGDGITVSGDDATANQTVDTAWTVKTDNDYLNANLNFAKPEDIPTNLGVLTIENITPHANGDFDFVSSDDALVVNPTPHGLSLAIDEDELDFVKGIITGNPATLTVSEADGVYTLTAIGGGSSGGGGILVLEGAGIKVDSDIVDIGGEDYTQYTIKADKTWLEDNLDFATNQDLADAIGNITIPEKTSDLVNDGADGLNPFISASDLPAIPDGTLPISSTDDTVKLDGASSVFTVSTGGQERVKVEDTKTTFNGQIRNVTTSGTVAYLESTTGGASIKLNSTDQDWWVGPNNFGFCIYNESNNQKKFVFDAAGNFIVNNGQVQTNSVSGLADNDASIALGVNAIIKSETGYAGLNSNQNGWDNKFRVNGNVFNYDTGVVNQETKRYVKETDGTLTQVVKEGVYGLTTTVNDWGAKEGHSLFRNLVGPHVIQAEQHVRLITTTENGDPNVTNPTAGVFLASSGTDSPKAQMTTSQSSVVCVDTSVQFQTQAAPNSSLRTRLTVKDTEIVSEVDVKTPSVSGLADSDASIELGANLLAQVGGKNQFQSTGNNCIRTLQVGSASAPALAFSDTTTGFFFAPDEDGKYDTNVSGIAFTIANANSGVSARELLRLQRDGQLVAADNYTPIQPKSIATRQFVVDQAGSAGLIDFGTPTDDTTPDSPNGSVLHDNLNLYVKGSTNWRKAALYPLDATGGGSNFPLPQPGEDAGIEWTSAEVATGTGSPNQETAVAVAGNAFWMWDQWSINGKDWYGTGWAAGGKTVTYPKKGLTVSYGQNVFCGYSGYSYDGQSWTDYTLKDGMKENNNSFFYQGKHFGGAGQRYFDGEGWVDTGMSGSLLNSTVNPGYTIACENSCASLNISDSNGTRFVHVYTAGDMADGTNRWTSAIVSAGANSGQPLTGITGLARHPENDICVAINANKAYVQSSPGNTAFREYDLPVAAGWAGLAYDGTHFIAVAEAENANISIRSEDGITWTQSTSLDNPGTTSIAAFNGRAITASSLPSTFGSGRSVSILVSGNQTASTQTTATLPLGTPVDTLSASSVDTGPMARLETQADANGFFDEEIKKRAPVVTLTQIEYDAIPADEIDDRTLYLIT